MKQRDSYDSLMKLGFFKSVDILTSLSSEQSTSVLIAKAKALLSLGKYQESLKVLETIEKDKCDEKEMNKILEMRFNCYMHSNNASTKCLTLLPLLANRKLTPKLHIYAAETYILQESTRSPNHPAIPHLLEVLKICPTAIELVEKLLFVGASISNVIENIPAGIVRTYLQSLQLSENLQYQEAIDCLMKENTDFKVVPTCILNQICLNAYKCGKMELFDTTSEIIPKDDTEIIDIRAERLKILNKKNELHQLVLIALNANENNSNTWVAFSHYLELIGDSQRALQASRKAILLDNRSRKAYMRHGELRMNKNDFKKALTSYMKAHQIKELLDSYTAIINCCCLLEDWEIAESFAKKAQIVYPFDSPNGAYSLGLVGIALRGRNPEKAIKFLQEALKKEPNNSIALDAMIEMKIKEDKLDLAEKILNEYKKVHDFYYWFKMGEIYGIKKDFEKALEYIFNASQIDPTNEKAKDMLNQLELSLRNQSDSVFDSDDDNI